ncbi:hypothetical protein [Duganella sp. LjRoot269]|uniref:hypothetical protein n=1 Tax=Duganella sp. LjRoot269 TaxID=3342305 RepID=UPI003ECC4C0D
MSNKLSLLVPSEITDSVLTSSTIVENDYTAYSAATTYALAARCIKSHRIYESQIAGNINHDPDDPINQFGTIVYWLDVGPTNRWAMFDNEVSTQSAATTSMTVVIKPGNFNTIYLGGLDALHLSISVKNAPGGTVIFTYSGSLESSKPSDYYQWAFDPFSFLRSKIVSEIPAYNLMELTVTISGATGSTVKCGVLAVGLIQRLGRTQQGAEAKPKTYSYVATDKYGKTTIKKGKAATDMTASAVIDSREARQVQEALQGAIDTPCMVSCSDNPDYSGLNIFGLVSGKVTYKTSETSEVSVSVEGLI